MGWQKGSRSGVRFAAIRPATLAASNGSPLGVPATSAAQARGDIRIVHSAVASRPVTSLAPTSTMRAAR